MMSLFNGYSKELNARSVSWEEFGSEHCEIRPFDKKREDTGFIALRPQSNNKEEFLPLTTDGGGQGAQYSGRENLMNAQEKLSLLEQDAYEKGFAQGEKDGFELGAKRAKKVIDNIENLLGEMTHLKEKIVKQYEKEILDLIFAVAEKIIGYRIKADESVIGESIRKALLLAGQKTKITVRVNPEDYDYVEKIRPALFGEFKEMKSMVVTADPSISKGGCFIETHGGDVDGSIEAQLEMVRQTLEAVWGDEAGNE